MATKVTEFKVKGSGYFPLDMLRYDSCWPADSSSVYNLHGLSDEGIRILTLRTYHKPTDARWLSFGWAVKAQKTIT
jgi:hypothetical protein